jgi:hypothetical protein
MIRINEHNTRRLARCYCRSLCRLYGREKLTHDEMEVIVRDITAMRDYAHLPLWSQFSLLPAGRVESCLRDLCSRNGFSPHTIEWLMSFARKGHTRVIGRAIREMDSFIMTVVVQVPEYVTITEERMRLARRNLQEYYRHRGVESFVDVGIQRVPSQPKESFIVPIVTEVFDATMRSLPLAP